MPTTQQPAAQLAASTSSSSQAAAAEAVPAELPFMQGVMAADRVDAVLAEHIKVPLDPLDEGRDLRRRRELFHVPRLGTTWSPLARRFRRQS